MDSNSLWKLLEGNSKTIIKKLKKNSIDSIVTDPPYEMGFMGKSWDKSGIAYDKEFWKECYRILKPGAYILVFAGARTYHRITCSIEDAGFLIHPQIAWVFGSGFPKGANLSKLIDREAGAKRDVKGEGRAGKNALGQSKGWNKTYDPHKYDITEPATEQAKEWDGWYYGQQSLKPALEPICMAQKPPEGKMVHNVLKYKTGAININDSRINTEDNLIRDFHVNTFGGGRGVYGGGVPTVTGSEEGRYPANLIHDNSEIVLGEFPNAGKSSGGRSIKRSGGTYVGGKGDNVKEWSNEDPGFGDSGSVARYFKSFPWDRDDFTAFKYAPKADSRERWFHCGVCDDVFHSSEFDLGFHSHELEDNKHITFHPTQKPIELIKYLCRLVTPKKGTILDPFVGTGTTILAGLGEGFRVIGIDQENIYLKMVRKRVEEEVDFGLVLGRYWE